MKLVAPERCTGCTACKAVCPRRAISMMPSADGCLHPIIDVTRCVECGACARVCPVTKAYAPDFAPQCHAARTRDRDLLKASSSGGIFSELARPVLASGGCVFGCALKSLEARHVKVVDESGLAELRGSKYVQSDMGDCYRECLGELNRGRRVLFSGTPCQIAGLRSFLGKDPDNLLCVALICHGVSSPMILREYICEEEARLGGKVTGIAFRDKTARPGDISFTLAFDTGGRSATRSEGRSNVYMRSFLDAYASRECCFSCAFRSGRCGADVVLGDFWGIEEIDDAYGTAEGASAVLAYTEKGRAAFAGLAVDSFPVRYSDIARRNANLDGDASRPRRRACFLKMIRQGGGGMHRFFERIDRVPLHLRFMMRLKDVLRPVYRRIKYGRRR